MGEEKLLTVREVGLMLGISEKEVMDLAESGALPAYKVGGVYLRFKKEQVSLFKKNDKRSDADNVIQYSSREQLIDFFYYNDFYILLFLVVGILLAIILRGS
jgi:excisionase family DNA binding protein